MLSNDAGQALLAGLALGTASIISMGPNNLMMIREGVTRGRVGLVASLVWGSYMLLLLTAFVLTDEIVAAGAPIRVILSWFGLTAILWFAFLSLRAACRPQHGEPGSESHGESRRSCFSRVMTVIWLNPLTYVELLLIPAAVCETFKQPQLRLEFVSGLVLMATAACYGYTFGGGACSTLFRRRRTLQVFDLASGFVLVSVAFSLAVSLVVSAP